MTRRARIAVLGGGAWGTALALAAKRAGNEVGLWARDAKTVSTLNTAGQNPRYLPGITFTESLSSTTSINEAVAGSDCILAAIPAQALHVMLDDTAALLPANVPIVACAKGIERKTGRLMSQIIAEALPENPVAALSGPSFATDVASGKPTAVTIASANEGCAAELATMLSGPHFRCYSTDDLIGVEIGGALKNVLAIAAGAVAGAGLGASAQAAVITRGFVELRRMGAAFGARPETLMGLSGLGDLILTCSSDQSRNFAYGVAAGRGENLQGLPLAEGVATASIALDIARRHGVETPIIDAVNTILGGKADIGEIVTTLMARPLKSEIE